MGSLLPAAIDCGLSSHHHDWTLRSDDALNIVLLHLFTTKQIFISVWPWWDVMVAVRAEQISQDEVSSCFQTAAVKSWNPVVPLSRWSCCGGRRSICFLVFSVWGFASLLFPEFSSTWIYLKGPSLISLVVVVPELFFWTWGRCEAESEGAYVHRSLMWPIDQL